ncbi:MAG: hypothetical protein D8M59_08745 [Planctomycetes bacterium]|nr:hypothetical protein [Planctomycetota bacterium]
MSNRTLFGAGRFVAFFLLIALGVALAGGCSTNSVGDQTISHGSQDYVMFPGTEPQPLSATESQRPRPTDVEPASLAPSPDHDEQLQLLVSQARDLLLENDELEAVQRLTEAKTVPGWTQSVHAPSVLFWLGHAHDRLGERVAAITEYRLLVARYPESGLARRARQRLTYLEANSAIFEQIR